jgi:hypothetical protein
LMTTSKSISRGKLNLPPLIRNKGFHDKIKILS